MAMMASSAGVQVYSVDWSQTRGENLIVSGSWDHTVKVVSYLFLPLSSFHPIFLSSDGALRVCPAPYSGTPLLANR